MAVRATWVRGSQRQEVARGPRTDGGGDERGPRRREERHTQSGLVPSPRASVSLFALHIFTWGHLPGLDSVNSGHCPAGPRRRGVLGELTGTSLYSPQS